MVIETTKLDGSLEVLGWCEECYKFQKSTKLKTRKNGDNEEYIFLCQECDSDLKEL